MTPYFIICAVLSELILYTRSDTTGAGDIMLNIQSLIQLPIPIKILGTKGLSIKQINEIIYKTYGFSQTEIKYIESQI